MIRTRLLSWSVHVIIEAEQRPVEAILRSWLADADITLFCGNWQRGALMEIIPSGRAQLLRGRYDGPFSGVRELRLRGSAHHVHLDLGSLTRAHYVISPSICHGFRPAFEIRFMHSEAASVERCEFGIALTNPYQGENLRAEQVCRYLARATQHAAMFQEHVSIVSLQGEYMDGTASDWAWIAEHLRAARRRAIDPGPASAPDAHSFFTQARVDL
jgi:hypothetical protein